MGDNGQTVGSRLLGGFVRLLMWFLFVLLFLYIFGFIDVILESAFTSVPTPIQLLDSAVSALSPGYDHETQLRVSLRLMQVTVLYFAVLVAVLRFMDASSRFSAQKDRLLFSVVLLSVLSVSVSAFLAVVSSLRFLTETVFVGALLSMGLAFLLSFLTPVLAVVSESRGSKQQGTDEGSQSTRPEPVEDNTDDSGEKAPITHALGWGHCAGDEQRPKE